MLKTINGTEIDIIRKNVKNINLSVLPPDGRVRLSAPYGISDRRIEEFVKSKLEWIHKHQELVIQRAGAKEAKRNNDAVLSDTQYRALICQYRSKLLPIIDYFLGVWQAKTGLYAESRQLRDMKTRWGSCTPKTRRIRFSVWLAEKPPELIEYVVLHELAHIAVPNHGPDFKAFMSAHMPDWRERQKRLNSKSNTPNQNGA